MVRAAYHLVALVQHVVTQVDPVKPTSGGLPGVTGIHTIMAWIMWIALAVCGASAVIGGGTMAFAHHSARPDLAVRAKTGMLWALAGAFLIGISIPLVNAMFGLG